MVHIKKKINLKNKTKKKKEFQESESRENQAWGPCQL